MRLGLLNEEAKNVKPLNDTRYASTSRPYLRSFLPHRPSCLAHIPLHIVKLTGRAVQNGATFLAESFLFAVAAGLVLGETYRSSRKETKRRDDVRERIEALEEEVQRARDLVARRDWEAELGELRERYVRQQWAVRRGICPTVVGRERRAPIQHEAWGLLERAKWRSSFSGRCFGRWTKRCLEGHSVLADVAEIKV